MTDDNPYAEEDVSTATATAYATDIAAFRRFCAERGLSCATPIAPDVLAKYLAAHAKIYAIATLRRRIAAISAAHTSAGLASPAADPVVRRTMRNIARQHGTRQRQSAALGTPEVRAMVSKCGTDLRGLRDGAILLVGFAGALRRSEIVGIDLEHLTFVPGSMRLLIERSKRDQQAEGAELVIPMGHHRHTCPVRSVQRWIEAAAIDSGPVFRGIDQWGTVLASRLHPSAIWRIIKARAGNAGLAVASYETLSPHGLRAGFITTAHRAGARADDIMRHTRHRSFAEMQRYIRRSDRPEDNPARLLDL
jgi:integrase